MSLYIGKEGGPSIHITQNPKSKVELVSNKFSDTLLHSDDNIVVLTPVYVKQQGYDTYEIYKYSPVYYLSYQEFNLGVLTASDRVLILVSSDSGVTFSVIDSSYDSWRKMFHTSDIVTCINEQGEFIVGVKIGYSQSVLTSTPESKLIVSVYKYSVLSIGTGTINIGNGNFIVGGTDLSDYNILSTSIVNTVDDSYPGCNFQVLNSKKGLQGSSFGINNNSIGSYYNSVFYPILGSIKGSTRVVQESIVYSTGSHTIFPPASAGLVVIKDVLLHDTDLSGNPDLYYYKGSFTIDLSTSKPLTTVEVTSRPVNNIGDSSGSRLYISYDKVANTIYYLGELWYTDNATFTDFYDIPTTLTIEYII